MFSGVLFFGAISFFNGAVLDKVISQSLFSLCLFSSVSSFWSIYKTNISIREAKALSIRGNRKNRIEDIYHMNNFMAKRLSIQAFIIGLAGCLYTSLLFDSHAFSWVWFVAFVCTSLGVASARLSDSANLAIAFYTSNACHGE